MAVWSLDLRVCATAYIVADTAEEAREKLKAHFATHEGERLEILGLEVGEGCAQDFEISGAAYDDDDLPEISLSPAMTVYAPSWEELPTYSGGDEEDEADDEAEDA
jgi:hypothetical protein